MPYVKHGDVMLAQFKATTVCTASFGIWKKSRLGETMEESSAIKATELNMDYFRNSMGLVEK